MEKFRNYVGLVLCLCIVTTVSTAQRKVETVAEKVMLFIDGAQVTRTKRVDIPAGNSALLFTGLSPYLDARSMQVSAKGKLTITNVNLQYNFLDSVAEAGAVAADFEKNRKTTGRTESGSCCREGGAGGIEKQLYDRW